MRGGAVALRAERAPAAAGEPGDVGRDVAVAGRHPRRRHRVGDVDGERERGQREVAAHVADPLRPVAHPEPAADAERDEEVRVVDGGEHDVVPLCGRRPVARITAQVCLQELGGEHPAEQPPVGGDGFGDVDADDAEVVGDASAVEVDRQQCQRRPPVPHEREVVAPRPLDVPGDDRQPDPGDRCQRLLGQAEHRGVHRQGSGVRRHCQQPKAEQCGADLPWLPHARTSPRRGPWCHGGTLGWRSPARRGGCRRERRRRRSRPSRRHHRRHCAGSPAAPLRSRAGRWPTPRGRARRRPRAR